MEKYDMKTWKVDTCNIMNVNVGDILIIHIILFDLLIAYFISQWNIICIPKQTANITLPYFCNCISANNETLVQTVGNPDELFFA